MKGVIVKDKKHMFCTQVKWRIVCVILGVLHHINYSLLCHPVVTKLPHMSGNKKNRTVLKSVLRNVWDFTHFRASIRLGRDVQPTRQTNLVSRNDYLVTENVPVLTILTRTRSRRILVIGHHTNKYLLQHQSQIVLFADQRLSYTHEVKLLTSRDRNICDPATPPNYIALKVPFQPKLRES